MSKQLSPLRELLPQVLAKLAKESGAGDRIAAVWNELVGPSIALNARPLALVGGVLTVRVNSPRWSNELTAQSKQLLQKLADALGPGYVRSLAFDLHAPGEK
ncbi:MAG: DciA family protein [Myxococcaceae bacterium]